MEAAGQGDGTAGVSSVLLYLMLYAVLVIGSFAVVTLVARDREATLDEFKGLARRRPVLALAFTVFLLAQAGVPFTSGFIAKFGVIQAAVEENSYAIAIIAMVAAVVAAFLYLRIMVSMWLDDADSDAPAVRIPFSAGLAITAAVVFTLFVGVLPGWLIDAADAAVAWRVDVDAAGCSGALTSTPRLQWRATADSVARSTLMPTSPSGSPADPTPTCLLLSRSERDADRFRVVAWSLAGRPVRRRLVESARGCARCHRGVAE